MSELAAAYYEQRAARMGVTEIPDLLDGLARPVMDLQDPLPALLSVRLANAFTEVEAFALEGVPLALEASHDRKLTDPQWQDMRERLHPYHTWPGAARQAKVQSGYLLHKPSDRGRVYVEALACKEVPDGRLAVAANKLAPSSLHSQKLDAPSQESVQVYLLSRLIAPHGVFTRAYLSVAWGSYAELGALNATVHPNNYLGVRYIGAPVLADQLSGLPPLRVRA